MSIEDVTDLMDLFEYDEFDSYDENTYQLIDEDSSGGVPLSVELLESLSKNQTPVSDEPTNSFVKAPEIFLRIDANGSNASTTDLCTASTSHNFQNIETIELKHCEKSNSLESSDSNDVLLLTKHGDCVELQYENEFSDESDCDRNQSERKQDNSIENDYEELLFEGIINSINLFYRKGN